MVFRRPGEVKDFAKKIKMEDGRINLRKQQLERILQQRARAQAQAQQKAENEIKDVKMSDTTSESTTAQTAATAASSTPAPPVIVQPVPTTPAQNALHPSLPLKPPSSPAPVQVSHSPIPVPAAATQLQTQPPARSTPPPAPTQALTLPPDSIITKHEESKHRWSWIALRTARDRYLQHFGKIGPGDIVQLEVEIEKEKREKEEAEAEAVAAMKVDPAVQNGNGNEDQAHLNSSEVNGDAVGKGEMKGDAIVASALPVRGEGDIRMEG